MKINKKALFPLLPALLLVFLAFAGEAQEPPETLEAVLLAAGAAFVEGEVLYFADLDRRFLNMDELEEILLEAALRLGLAAGQREQSEGETYRVFDLKAGAPGRETRIVVQSNPGDSALGLPPQTYLLVFGRHTSLAELKKAAPRLEAALRPLAPSGQASVFLTGSVPARLSAPEMAALAERAVRAVDGRLVEKMEDDGLLSVSAYTPRIGRHLTSGGERINLNIALQSDVQSGTTAVLAGFPVIHGTY